MFSQGAPMYRTRNSQPQTDGSRSGNPGTCSLRTRSLVFAVAGLSVSLVALDKL